MCVCAKGVCASLCCTSVVSMRARTAGWMSLSSRCLDIDLSVYRLHVLTSVYTPTAPHTHHHHHHHHQVARPLLVLPGWRCHWTAVKLRSSWLRSTAWTRWSHCSTHRYVHTRVYVVLLLLLLSIVLLVCESCCFILHGRLVGLLHTVQHAAQHNG